MTGSSNINRQSSLSLSIKVLGGLALILAMIMSASFFLQYLHDRDEGMKAFEEQSSTVSELIRVGLESAMLRNDFASIEAMVKDLEGRHSVEKILILNPESRVAVSSDPAKKGSALDMSGADCISCHSRGASGIPSTAIIPVEGKSGIFRRVSPIINREPCHRCHDPGRRINGILILDLSMAEFERGSRKMLIKLATVSILTAAAMMALAFPLLNRFVLSRVRNFKSAIDSMDSEGRLPPVSVESGDEFGALATAFNDMSSSLAARMDELRRNRADFENLLESIQDEIIVIDENGKIIRANRQARKRLGIKEGDEYYCKDSFRCSVDPLDCCPALLSFKDSKSRSFIEWVEGPRGELVEMEAHSFPVLSDTGKVSSVVLVSRDISTRKKLEARLVQADRMALMGQMASGVAHEINNPLGTIAVCIDGLNARMDDWERGDISQIKKYLQIIRRESYRCKTIVSNMLDFARKRPAKFEPHHLRDLIDETLSIIQYQAKSLGKTIAVETPSNMELVVTDGAKLKQVFLNLILNALDAMQKDQELNITVNFEKNESGERRAVIRFADNGAGIPEHLVENVFEPFFSTKSQQSGSGTGLGLYISRNLIEQLGGTIFLKSRVGEGTTVTVELPLAPSPEVLSQAPAELHKSIAVQPG